MPAGYETLFDLASGGIGTVSLVVRREGTFERLYALKRLLPVHGEDDELRAMFCEEAKIAGLVRHPNVVPVLDTGSDAQGPYLVMEYVAGVTVVELITALGRAGELPVPLGVALDVGAQAARGLQAVHELVDHRAERLNPVHRDVSPQNLLLGVDGVVRLTDFGIAKISTSEVKTSSGVLKGKLGYMAPEQLRFEAATQASDVFALGVVMFELLSGGRLYRRSREDELAGVKRILHEPPPDLGESRPDAPPALVELMLAALAKDAATRPTAGEFATRLEEIAAETEDDGVDLRGLIQESMSNWFSERSLRIRHALQLLDTLVAPSIDPPPKRRVRAAWALAALAAACGAALGIAWGVRAAGGSGGDATTVAAELETPASPEEPAPRHDVAGEDEELVREDEGTDTPAAPSVPAASPRRRRPRATPAEEPAAYKLRDWR